MGIYNFCNPLESLDAFGCVYLRGTHHITLNEVCSSKIPENLSPRNEVKNVLSIVRSWNRDLRTELDDDNGSKGQKNVEHHGAEQKSHGL